MRNVPEAYRQQMTAMYESLKANYMKLKANVDLIVEDGDELPYCGGITVIHTPGHLCLYHKPSKTLVAGDALNVEGGMLVHAPLLTCLDKEQYAVSLKKLTMFDIRNVICYHGGLYTDDPNRRIMELTGISF